MTVSTLCWEGEEGGIGIAATNAKHGYIAT